MIRGIWHLACGFSGSYGKKLGGDGGLKQRPDEGAHCNLSARQGSPKLTNSTSLSALKGFYTGSAFVPMGFHDVP